MPQDPLLQEGSTTGRGGAREGQFKVPIYSAPQPANEYCVNVGRNFHLLLHIILGYVITYELRACWAFKGRTHTRLLNPPSSPFFPPLTLCEYLNS